MLSSLPQIPPSAPLKPITSLHDVMSGPSVSSHVGSTWVKSVLWDVSPPNRLTEWAVPRGRLFTWERREEMVPNCYVPETGGSSLRSPVDLWMSTLKGEQEAEGLQREAWVWVCEGPGREEHSPCPAVVLLDLLMQPGQGATERILSAWSTRMPSRSACPSVSQYAGGSWPSSRVPLIIELPEGLWSLPQGLFQVQWQSASPGTHLCLSSPFVNYFSGSLFEFLEPFHDVK